MSNKKHGSEKTIHIGVTGKSFSLIKHVLRVILSIGMLVSIVIWILPILGVVVNSFRSYTDVTSSGWWTAIFNMNFTLNNYKELFSYGGLFNGFKNSILIAVPSTILLVICAAAAAFALKWTDLPGREWIYNIIVSMVIIPPEITLYPTLVILKAIGLDNTYPGIWMSHVASALPFGVFLIGSFISEIPCELVEAAKVDGAKTVQQFTKIILPLSGSALMSLATFDFLWIWNDLLRSLVIIPDTSKRPLTAILANVSGGYGEYISVIAAGATLLMLPPVLVFLLAQKSFIRGVTAGAMKG